MFDGNVRLLSATRTMQWSKPVKKCIEGNTADVRTTEPQPFERKSQKEIQSGMKIHQQSLT